MSICSLAEVGARLEESVSWLPIQATCAQDVFNQYEMVAIQILDSEFLNFKAGVLERYLTTLLYLKQQELDLAIAPTS